MKRVFIKYFLKWLKWILVGKLYLFSVVFFYWLFECYKHKEDRMYLFIYQVLIPLIISATLLTVTEAIMGIYTFTIRRKEDEKKNLSNQY